MSDEASPRDRLTQQLRDDLAEAGHDDDCIEQIIDDGYPCDDPGGICWCGRPDGWRKPTSEELDES